MSRHIRFKTSEFICPDCGQKTIPIPRRTGSQRENGHIKDIWCVRCSKVSKCLEIKENTGYMSMAGWIY